MGQYVQKDCNGIDRILWRQEMGSSCGPACCFMVVCLVKKQSFGGGEAFMRSLAIKYGSSLSDMMNGAGTYGKQLYYILKDNGLKLDERMMANSEYYGMLLAASENNPVILNVKWENNRGHWVVCIGANRCGAIILDPWYGLREVPLNTLPAYNPDPKPPRSLLNRFSGWFVRVL